MSLDIWTNDGGSKSFQIGYITFTNMRACFVLHYGEELYNDYQKIIKALGIGVDLDSLFDNLCKQVGDLRILLEHSDCDGELTSNECKLLKPCLFVDEDIIRKVKDNNPEYTERIIKKMYEFIDLVDYCASNDEVKLIFG